MKIRKATQRDAPHIATVHVDSWRTTYKGILPCEFLKKLSYEQRTKLWESNVTEENVYVVENEDEEIVGFATGGKKKTENYDQFHGELYAIYILEEYQGKGIGKMLMQPVIKELEQFGINSIIVLVLEDNPSKYFYEALGAREIDSLEITIAGVELNELVYGWDDLSEF
ncbi:L-amino acid N-acyltransferase YncA [Virgibacillus natechei]|uniref:L-amino acid N-acyltransferase YncA n=1 Tax=Virgibacillus natechei TaxID=1216297 RepID=A0ABS4IJD1_9BACI|nr:GNAT family N-acetyltransferase [Virgibacillus natechei]MBP1970541.1 L-amino acid N-acyltransferase YncA [Virgibacillus natechei]UZD14056.1 GNAT family N-acetyltransferase [Virgibacillus natechei]